MSNSGRQWRRGWASRSKADENKHNLDTHLQQGVPDDPGRSCRKETNTEKPIDRFSGEHKWLGNFSWSDLVFEGLCYPSVEHAFQAAKLLENDERNRWGFTDAQMSFGAAKRLGRKVPLREDWKDIREDVMFACLAAKFKDPCLKQKLLGTGSSELIDGHSGSPDLIWGYHFPSKAGDNRLGVLLMDLRAQLALNTEQEVKDNPKVHSLTRVQSANASSHVLPSQHVDAALFILDWPMKCLHDGIPQAYADRIHALVTEESLGGRLLILPRRKICIAVHGSSTGICSWERKMRTQHVDVNSRGRPCRERMLVQLFSVPVSEESAGNTDMTFASEDIHTWQALQASISKVLSVSGDTVHAALGPEPPELPRNVQYLEKRAAVLLDGRRYPLCLNDHDAEQTAEKMLGDTCSQLSHGPGDDVPLGHSSGKPSIFGGKFARVLRGLLNPDECERLISFSEQLGYGLAGSRGFNPFARFAQRCLVDAPLVASALSVRLAGLLPKEYPPGSGRLLVGVNERLRFLKYTPGMHHAGDHTDCAHEDPLRGRSFLTVQLYLNDSFSGGQTTFISDQLVPIKPSVGAAIVFDHELYHRGAMVAHGTKYAMRLDVLYGHAGAVTQQESVSPPKGNGKSRKRFSSTDAMSGVPAASSHSNRSSGGRWGRRQAW